MNEDHAEAVRLYATKLLGAEDGKWRLTGLDPDGLDLALGDATLRLPFPERVTDCRAIAQGGGRTWPPRRAAAISPRTTAVRRVHSVRLHCSTGTREALPG